MKNIKSILCLLSIVILTSCTRVDYDETNVDSMSILGLNQYIKDLESEKEFYKVNNEKLLDISGNKTKEEIIDLVNYVNNEIIKSNVMITNESKSFFHTTSVSSGSGTIIKEDDNYYYVLTNNHVIFSLGNRSTYYIYDYLNNEYSASVMFYDANYDMALLRFNKGGSKLRVTSLAIEDIRVDENLIAIGQPLGQRNAITFGEVMRYERVECSNCNVLESNIQYECVFYDAITTNGNSGGMIINYNYELVGVVTYGMSSANGEYMYGAGSPVSKVKEFLANNSFEVGDNNA